jgi:hypothetical protein
MLRWIAALLIALSLAACALPAQQPPDAEAAQGTSAPPSAKPAPKCEPEPYCYSDCLRGYQPGYCRFKCGC